MRRVFLLSPAQCGGRRAGVLCNPEARFALASRLRADEGVTIGEVMSFLSGLYFRGKSAYARAFAKPPAGCADALVITPSAGLWPLDRRLDLATLSEFAGVPVDRHNRRFLVPFRRSAARLGKRLEGRRYQVVLLGSFATQKYTEVLLSIFGNRLVVPRAFVGLGDMSRGALMLQAARRGEELAYVPLQAL